MENITIQANGIDFGHIGWKYYNKIRKKAMEQEFSWSGLLISLSIAFFIVISSSIVLGLFYRSVEKLNIIDRFAPMKIYRLEGTHNYSLENYLQSDLISIEKIEEVRSFNLA